MNLIDRFIDAVAGINNRSPEDQALYDRIKYLKKKGYISEDKQGIYRNEEMYPEWDDEKPIMGR